MRNFLLAHLRSGDSILLIDVIQTDDSLWLVPEWLQTEDGKLQTPARAIRLDKLQYQNNGIKGADLTVNQDIPEEVLDGLSTSVNGVEFEVVDGAAHFGWFDKPLVS